MPFGGHVLSIIEPANCWLNGCRYVSRQKRIRSKSNAMNRRGGLSRLGRRPVKQGPRYQSGNQGWIEKCATGRQTLKLARQQLTVGTWNVRTMWATGKLDLLREEMKRYRYDILGLSEIRWTQG